MDFSELTKTVVDRVRKLEPENFRRIIGFILLNEPSEPEMIELAYSPENTLMTRIDEAKIMLANLSPNCSTVSSKKQSDTFSSAFHCPAQYWDHQLASDQPPLCDNSSEFAFQAYPDSTEENYSIFDQSQLLNLEENYLYSDATLGGSIPPRTSRRSPSLPEFPIKACHYFFKGYCKHGANCRYFHGHSFPEGYSAAFGPSLNDLQIEEHGFSPGSLEKLEMEITDLLRSRRGMPVSIASLPMLYYEKYGKNLQADGYLTESQRHGKAGFSLTKLLARLKSSIRLIDRPHGQHSVILAEDVSKFLECRNERSEQGSMATSAHQIYLTFPSESTFTEDDVSNYFKQFGPVRDVRIPCQEKRMFGFVSFIYSETVSEILMKRIPHFICGARVLVKPYREKTRMVDRMYNEKIKPAIYYTSQYGDLDSSELHALPREFESSRELKLHLEEQEQLLELERTRFSDFSLLQRPLNQQSYFSHDIGNLKLQFPDEFPLEDHFSYTLEALHSGSSTEDNDRSTSSNYNQLESCPIELPESPFAFLPPVGSSIPTVI